MQRLRLALLIACLPLEASAPGFHEERWERFMVHASQFQRKLLGCPAAGFPPEIECKSERGTLDNRLWSVIQEEGRQLFVLQK